MPKKINSIFWTKWTQKFNIKHVHVLQNFKYKKDNNKFLNQLIWFLWIVHYHIVKCLFFICRAFTFKNLDNPTQTMVKEAINETVTDIFIKNISIIGR